MAVSTFDLFKIGIGPSSSHTVGPMRAAERFIHRWLLEPGRLPDVVRVRAEVFGSLALTGRGHGTDKAVLLGLEGHRPNLIDPDIIPAALERIRARKRINLMGQHEIAFDEKRDLPMNKRQKLPYHTNGMRFTAYDADDAVIATRDYYSVGGGFVVNQDDAADDRIVADETPLPYPFLSGDELLAQCARSGLSIAELMFENEKSWRSEDAIRDGLRELWAAMQSCVARGIREEGTLPGGLHVSRRAPSLHRELSSKPEAAMRDPLTTLDWVNLYALAVNEENAPVAAWSPPRPMAPPASSRQCCTTSTASAPAASSASSTSCSPPRRSASSTRRTPRSPAPRSAARARSAWPARWPPAAWSPRSAATPGRSRTPPRSAWNTTSA